MCIYVYICVCTTYYIFAQLKKEKDFSYMHIYWGKYSSVDINVTNIFIDK